MKALVVIDPKHRENSSQIVADVLRTRGFHVVCQPGSTIGNWNVIVSWKGVHNAPPSKSLVLNPPAAVRLAQTYQNAAFLLYVHGIPVLPHLLPKHTVRPASPPELSEMRTLRIHVGDLRVLAVDGEDALANMSRWREQRLMETVCRAVYVLGLHFGTVHVHVHTGGRWYVSHVDPHPNVSADLARAFGSTIATLAATWYGASDPCPETVLGADPEFALFSQEGRLLYASKYVKHRGTIGYDRQSRANRGAYFPLVEVRPHPSPSPLVVFSNIEKALASARQLLPHRQTRWVAGSFPFGKYPTGGHIHFSGPRLTTPLLVALDHYLALPTMLLEHRVRGRKRRQKYGRLGDFRRKEHGGFEYRTLASWLVTPGATRAVLTLSKVVAEEWRQLGSEPISQTRIAKEFYRSKKTRFRQLFPTLWETIMRTETAKRYRYELAYFPRAIRAGEEWKDEEDIKPAWW